ncbi:MAG: Uma2 family endonuclease [Coleofasciculaceae cyanobacterium]
MKTQQKYYTPEEYLALEEAAEYKSEYIDGEIFPMAGGSTNHNQVALNFSTELTFAFKKLDYRVFMSDVHLWIPEKRIYTYPDVMVIEGEPEYVNDRTDMITNPKIIVEVLSDSTKGYDQSGKFEAYRTIPSFAEYFLLNPHKIHIEQYSKTANKRWSFREYDAEDEAIIFTALEFEISLADLYNKVQFKTQEIKEN